MVVALLWLSSSSFAQEANNYELESITKEMNNIRAKRDWVKSVPEENTIAITEGWYELVDQKLAILASRKRSIIKTQTGKRWISIEEFDGAPVEKQQAILSDTNYIVEQ
jgi:hypothetical protein